MDVFLLITCIVLSGYLLYVLIYPERF
ncbi:MAG: potassium-transporting ATPase subunit F [Sphingobacteriia bacterium]